MRQDHDAAHDRGVRASLGGRILIEGRRWATGRRTAAGQHGFPALRALSPHERTRRTSGTGSNARGGQAESAAAGRGGSGDGPAAACRERKPASSPAASSSASRWRAHWSTGRRSPARRTAGRARPQAAQGDATRAEALNRRSGATCLCDARPGRSADDVDRIAVMNDGRILQQVAHRGDLRAATDPFVADFSAKPTSSRSMPSAGRGRDRGGRVAGLGPAAGAGAGGDAGDRAA